MAVPTQADNDNEPPVMTWWKAIPVLAVALVFWALRFMFEQFWFFGPFIAGAVVSSYLGGGWAASVLGTTVSIATGVVEYFTGPMFEVFGIIMAMAVGFLGWLANLTLMAFTNLRLFKRPYFWLELGGALLVAIVPFVGSVPSVLAVTFNLYRRQIKEDKAAHRAWAARQAARAAEDRAEIAALASIQRLELEQARAAQAANDNETEEQPTADDGEEIPAPGRRAAAQGLY